VRTDASSSRGESSPDLTAERGIAVEKADAPASLRGNRSGGHSPWPAANDHDIIRSVHSVTTFMPEAQVTWQARR
jgi:hypothetical protein